MNYLINTQTFDHQQASKTSVGGVFNHAMLEILTLKKTTNQWLEISKQRRALLNLSDEQLKDVGISRQQATTEAEKFFWQ